MLSDTKQHKIIYAFDVYEQTKKKKNPNTNNNNTLNVFFFFLREIRNGRFRTAAAVDEIKLFAIVRVA